MFGLVKASRLRQAESERDEWKQFSADHAEQAAKDIRRLIKHRDNWHAIADSRLVAVLLLRERWDAQYTMADAAIRMDHAHVRNYERTIESMEERETAIAAERDAANRQVADQERTIAMMDERFNAVASAHDTAHEFNMKLSARMMDIEHILEAEQPLIETAIIRPSSTNRLRWRVNDDDGKALGQGSTGYATVEEATAAFVRAAYLISLDRRAPEDDRIERIREVLTREPDDPGNTTMALAT